MSDAPISLDNPRTALDVIKPLLPVVASLYEIRCANDVEISIHVVGGSGYAEAAERERQIAIAIARILNAHEALVEALELLYGPAKESVVRGDGHFSDAEIEAAHAALVLAREAIP
jgi:hypothetical protein